MKPRDHGRNGFDGTSSDSDSDSSSGGGDTDDLSLFDAEAPRRALAALNALRKARQHYDLVLEGEAGGEVAAHSAVLAAHSPALLAPAPPVSAAAAASNPATPASPAPHTQMLVAAPVEALRTLVEYMYTGRLTVADAAAAVELYGAARVLRVEAVRAHVAERLVRRLAPNNCLTVRALPDLASTHRKAIDEYIASNLETLWESGALSSLPCVRVELLRGSSSEDGSEAPAAVAAAALHWLRECLHPHQPRRLTMEELCSRTHLLFVGTGGALKDCGELPEHFGDAPELSEYRRAAGERDLQPHAQPQPHPNQHGNQNGSTNGTDNSWCVIGCRAVGARATRALLALGGSRLALVVTTWRELASAAARPAPLGPRAAEPPAGSEGSGEPRATLRTPRCAHAAAALQGTIVVCGGYDRASALRSVEQYSPATNTWRALPAMSRARARCPAAALGAALYALGGSDGASELDTVDALVNGAWKSVARLPVARSHAAAAADESRGVLYCVGGWAGGVSLRSVHRYEPATNTWTEAPALRVGRSQCACVLWRGALWALGGCDAWRCLASTETLRVQSERDEAWQPGPPLPTARRSMGAAVWRGRLVAAGGSEGGASLRRVDWLLDDSTEAPWREGPPLRRARAALALIVLGGGGAAGGAGEEVMYAVGGYSGKEFLACVECLHDPSQQWTALRDPRPPRAPLRAARDEGGSKANVKEDKEEASEQTNGAADQK